MPEIILASNSPRRRQMLAWTGWTFTVSPVDIDESPQPGEPPELYVARLARSKGKVRAAQLPAGGLVLAADTIVADGPTLLGKPAGPDDAVRMLRQLRGRSHLVCTAITLLSPEKELASDRCCSNVPMRAYTDEEIEAYVATGDPLDKAGAYAIQHTGFHPVENFQGCFASVMGLPLCHLARDMQHLGYSSPKNVPATCQANLGYACPIYQAVLAGEDVG